MNKNNLTNFTAKNGAIIGAGFILAYMVTHLINGKLHTMNDISGNINSILLIAGIIIFTRKYRADFNRTYFPYGEAFKVGFFTSIFAAIVGDSFYTFTIRTSLPNRLSSIFYSSKMLSWSRERPKNRLLK